MDRFNRYHGSQQELRREIAEINAIVHANGRLHEDPVEDIAIRGIWEALLIPLQQQLEEMERTGVA